MKDTAYPFPQRVANWIKYRVFICDILRKTRYFPMSRPLKSSLKADEIIFPKNGVKRRRFFKRILALVLLAILFSCMGTMVVPEIWPYFGAQVANHMRNLIGPQAVAQIEAIVFQVQDTVKHWQYQYGVEQAEAPWGSSEIPLELTPFSQVSIEKSSLTPESARLTPTPPAAIETPAYIEQSKEPQDQLPVKAGSPTPTPTPYVWQLSTLIPFGSMEGEGVWLPYLNDREGHVVAVRTFLQPDPERPYAIVAVVAFDLTRTQLHFVLGFNEPSLPDGPKGDGLIPEEDREAGVLLAAFNGGFRAANGQFGAMADGIVALPPKSEMATVGIYRSGEVRIGIWGEEINDTPDLQAWRQNCRLIIQDGEISPRVYNNSITDWGASISNQIVTRRSSLGLDREAKTLYYFAGPSLSMSVLANAMLAAGVQDGMLLDINHFWVLFTAIHSEEGKLVAEPLLPNDMIDHIDRYLGSSPADFFYITLLDSRQP
ncbi:MAG: hypothetical protein MUO30_09450 [Anaerolineales bacterium]|nr:hypothetical protein [Anaerolineales bacterium]